MKDILAFEPDLTLMLYQTEAYGEWRFHYAYPSGSPLPMKYGSDWAVCGIRGRRLFIKPEGKTSFSESGPNE